MKTNILYKYLHFCSGIVLISGSLILTGCSTETTRSEENILAEEKVAVTFSIGGITDEEITTSDPNALMASAKPLTVTSKSKTTSIGDLDIITSLETAPIEASQAITKNAVAAAGITPYATTKPMDQDKTFRVLVYNSNNQFVGSIDQIVKGTAVTLDLVKGGSYKWYAFSFNDTNPLPAIDPVTLQVPVANKDLLYAKSIGTFTANAGDNHQVITFNHAMAKINITIDARYVPANIGTVDAGFSSNTTYIKQGNFDLRAQSFATTSSYTTGASNFVFSDTNTTSTGSFVKNAVLYTAPDGAAINSGNFIVHINSITLDDFSVTPVKVSNTDRSYGSVTPLKGNGYNFRITIQRGTTAGGNFWATGNLWYDASPSAGLYKYKIRPDANNRSDSKFYNTDYWAYGSLTPNGSVNSTTTDPCTLVYPQNTWRMPTATDFSALAKQSDLSSSNGSAGFYGSIATNPTTKKTVKFGWDGDLIGSAPIYANSMGVYWQSDKGFFGNEATKIQGSTIDPGNFGFQSNRLNIRCIRK
ncbi:hypothetical protein [Elizabethkingia meningoseptica]|uniref:hypothetical protein n=1 Tax=Elizabethkingia meningoseptica TaxID=238 RepID=UPI0023B0B830|nr:hypothetical protein [Elizabethkingia meningoseptica]